MNLCLPYKCLRSSVKFGGKSKPVIHYLSSSLIDKEDNQGYPILSNVHSCYDYKHMQSVDMLTLAFPGNGSRNACWYFLTSMLSL
jgi:hypothetical protein